MINQDGRGNVSIYLTAGFPLPPGANGERSEAAGGFSVYNLPCGRLLLGGGRAARHG